MRPRGLVPLILVALLAAACTRGDRHAESDLPAGVRIPDGFDLAAPAFNLGDGSWEVVLTRRGRYVHLFGRPADLARGVRPDELARSTGAKDPGERFGGRLPCTYGRLEQWRTPQRSRVVADFSEVGEPNTVFTALIRADDAAAAVRELKSQAEGTDPELLERTEPPELEQVDHEGATTWRLSVQDNAGGGGCSATTSADNRWVLVRSVAD
jgi:hypothetical protein